MQRHRRFAFLLQDTRDPTRGGVEFQTVGKWRGGKPHRSLACGGNGVQKGRAGANAKDSSAVDPRGFWSGRRENWRRIGVGRLGGIPDGAAIRATTNRTEMFIGFSLSRSSDHHRKMELEPQRISAPVKKLVQFAVLEPELLIQGAVRRVPRATEPAVHRRGTILRWGPRQAPSSPTLPPWPTAPRLPHSAGGVLSAGRQARSCDWCRGSVKRKVSASQLRFRR